MSAQGVARNGSPLGFSRSSVSAATTAPSSEMAAALRIGPRTRSRSGSRLSYWARELISVTIKKKAKATRR